MGEEETALSQSHARGYRQGVTDGVLLGGDIKRAKIIAMLDKEYKLISKKGTHAGKGSKYDEGYLTALQDIIILAEEVFSE